MKQYKFDDVFFVGRIDEYKGVSIEFNKLPADKRTKNDNNNNDGDDDNNNNDDNDDN